MGELIDLNRGVDFPADAVPSSNLNTLDDYEEGNWIPRIECSTTVGTGTYITQSGVYTKIGNRVFLNGFVEWTAHTGAGNMRIAGLPFASNFWSPVSFWFRNISMSAGFYMLGYIDSNSTVIQLAQVPTGPVSGFNGVPLDTAAGIMLAGSYSVA